METRFRSDYVGEFVILETSWADRRKKERREWVPNQLQNQHISGRAACIGTNADFAKFDYRILQRHRGGLLGSKKLQTYGVGIIAEHMQLDFTVESNVDQLKKLMEENYQHDNIVYTTARNCINNPEQFYLIPYRPKMLDMALVVYLAAFDEHKEIFLLGYSKDLNVDVENWNQQFVEIFRSYPGATFYLVGEPTNMPAPWLDEPNTKTLTYRQFIGYCDV